MGAPVSSIVYMSMEYFEKKSLNTAPHPPYQWMRYVYDTHIIVKKPHSQKFTDYLNSVNGAIKWTAEGDVVTAYFYKLQPRQIKERSLYIKCAKRMDTP